MDTRAVNIINSLGLVPHPEGGYFREIFRSLHTIQPADTRSARTALTTIYFLLHEGQVSRLHRVASDEVWHYYEGHELELYCLDPAFQVCERWLLGPVGEESLPVRVIPAGFWQAARTTGSYTLVGCSVSPGFEFEDFLIIDGQSEVAEEIFHRFPALVQFI